MSDEANTRAAQEVAAMAQRDSTESTEWDPDREIGEALSAAFDHLRRAREKGTALWYKIDNRADIEKAIAAIKRHGKRPRVMTRADLIAYARKFDSMDLIPTEWLQSREVKRLLAGAEPRASRRSRTAMSAEAEPPIPGLFGAFVQPEANPYENYSVHLVNDTDINFPRVDARSGEFISTDTAVHEGNVITREAEPLGARSARKLYEGEYWELDFVQWWHLDVYRSEDTDPVKVWFQTGGFGNLRDVPEERLPLLNVTGQRVALRVRTGE